MSHFRFAACLIALLVATPAFAQTSYPMLMSLKPNAAKVGASSVHTVSARYSMYGANKVLITGQGVRGEVVTKMKPVKAGQKTPSLTKIQVRFTVDADAKPGVRDFRIATPNGVSTLGQLVIARDAVTVEKGKNNTPETANTVQLPSTICGCIERNEDVDYYKFTAKAGQGVTFHVRCMRLQDRMHDLQRHADPIISIKNAAGSTLAQSDNHHAADPLLHHRFEQAGEYYLEIRDVRYHGNVYWEYCIEAIDRPFVTAVHPLGVQRGTTAKVGLIGHQLSKGDSATLKVNKEIDLGPQSFDVSSLSRKWLNPVSVVVSDRPQVNEADADNDSYKSAQQVATYSGINGRIASPNDIDCFAFAAKKGQKFAFEVYARRCDSMLDSHLRILDGKTGRQLTFNDDMRLNRRSLSDSKIDTWSAPKDGTYVIEVRDLHLRGGEDFVYHISVTPAEPTFELYLDTDKTQLTPGTSAVIFARAMRKNGFTGGIQLAVDNLPPGVTATCGKILPGKPTDGCIILTAAANAKPTAVNINVQGTATVKSADGKSRSITVKATPQQETYMPGGGRNHWHVDMHTVSVAAPNDIRAVKLSTYDVRLKPGESKRIEVTIERSPGYNKNVTLDLLYRHLSSRFADTLPPGVTIDARNSKTLLTGKTSKGHITLKAAKTAKPVKRQQVSVMANISLNFVMKATYSAKPLFVSVE